jgi:hypothetical protein
MASIQQLQRGATRFVDNELVPAFAGPEKIAVGGAAALLIANAENIVKQYSTHPMVALFGVYKDGDINVDALYQAFAPRFGVEKIPIKIPIIGNIKIGKPEVDKLYQYIKEA